MSDDFDPYRCRGVTPPGGPTMEELTAATWKERALRAEQRAAAAEAERDRMRPIVEAAVAWSKWNPKHGLLAAIDAYRAGQPGPSEAERIAQWLESQMDVSTFTRITWDDVIEAIRAGAWRKGQG